VVGSYGDNLDNTAEKIARDAGLALDMARCKELGVLINYNAYGASVEDLHMAPDQLFRRLLQYAGPTECLAEDAALVDMLSEGYDSDMRKAETSPRLIEDETLAVIDIPGGYLVSIRAPLNNRSGADEVARQFATGGGRAAAAGINELPADEVETLIEAMRRQYG